MSKGIADPFCGFNLSYQREFAREETDEKHAFQKKVVGGLFARSDASKHQIHAQHRISCCLPSKDCKKPRGCRKGK